MDQAINPACFLLVPLQMYAGVYTDFPKMRELSSVETLLLQLGSFALWVALHGRWLASSAQSIGKRLLGLQIVNASDGKPTSFARIVLLRTLPMYLLAVPVVGNPIALLGVLLIFRRGRRCLHDHIAGTRVVMAPARAARQG